MTNLTLSDNTFRTLDLLRGYRFAFSLEEGEATFLLEIQNGVIMLTVTTNALDNLGDYEATEASFSINKHSKKKRRSFYHQNIYMRF